MAKRRKQGTKGRPAKGRQRDMADSLWSHAVRADWAWKCAVCGAIPCEAHHILPREWEVTRYDMMNGIALCSTHHRFDPELSPHQNGPCFTDWIYREQPTRREWLRNMIQTGDFKRFKGTKNEDYYCAHIRRLKQYVEPEDYTRIVGVKFSQWLDANE